MKYATAISPESRNATRRVKQTENDRRAAECLENAGEAELRHQRHRQLHHRARRIAEEFLRAVREKEQSDDDAKDAEHPVAPARRCGLENRHDSSLENGDAEHEIRRSATVRRVPIRSLEQVQRRVRRVAGVVRGVARASRGPTIAIR